MADLPSRADLFRVARDEALARQGKLTREAVERDGSDSNVLLAGGAAAAEEVLAQLAIVEAELFLDSATGNALDRLVFDRYGLVRKQAAPALGQVEFRTTALNPFAFVISAGTVLSAANGVQYVTTLNTTFPASSIGPVVVLIRSALAGSSQNAAPNTIVNIISQITGAPSDLTVNNSLATAGAADAEADDSLRARARAFFTTATKGTKNALIQGALAVPGVLTASVFEGIDSFGNPASSVQLVVSDAFTSALATLTTAPPPSYAAQAQTLATNVFLELSDVRAFGIYVQVIVAQVILQPVLLGLTFQAGVDTNSVATQARAAAVNYVNGLAPGASFVPSGLVTLLRIIPGLFVTGGEVLSPAGIVIANPLQVLRTSLELVTVGNLG